MGLICPDLLPLLRTMMVPKGSRPMNELSLAPSSLSFLFEECKRCFYDAAWGLGKRPMLPMPKIFTSIDAAMKRHFAKGWHRLGPNMPHFRIVSQSRRVRSRSVAVAGTDLALYIRGYYDSLIEFESGERAIIDWKTSEVRADLARKYGRSLHAYAYCLAYPFEGTPQAIDWLGLGVFAPETFRGEPSMANLTGRMQWVPIDKDIKDFELFLQGTGMLLAGERPAPNFGCPYCAYRSAA